MKKVGFILCLLMGPVLMESCLSHCNPIPSKEFSITGASLTTSVMDGSGYEAAPHSLRPSSMYLQFTVSAKYAALHSSHDGTMGAYACDVFPNHSKEKFTQLKITADAQLIVNNKSEVFAAGADLSPLFLQNNFGLDAPVMESFTFTPTFSVADKVNQNFHFLFTLDDGRTFDLESGLFELLPN